MRICDVLFAFEGFASNCGRGGNGKRNAYVIIAVAIFSIRAFARLVRGNTLVLAADLYESARSDGANDANILFPITLAERYRRCGLLYNAYWRVDYLRRQPVISGAWRAARRRRSGERCSTKRGRI